ncbi:MAG: DUF3772 domain-containing protein [Pseudomonadota bacterium]
MRGSDDPVYQFWEEVVSNAERLVYATDGTTNDDLEVLRARLATFRTEFSNQRNANAERIANLRSQIDALGPVPEDGIEAPEITAKRVELENELERFEAPVRVADAAFQQASGLINEIDRILRERQKRKLLALGPSPVDPRNWPAAFDDIGRMLAAMQQDAEALSSQREGERLQDRLPLVVFLIVISLIVIAKGRRWAGAGVEYMRQFGGRGSGVWTFLVSLLRIFVPLAGVYIFTYAIRLANVVGPTVEDLLSWLPFWGLFLLGFYWLAERLFGRQDDDALIFLPGPKRRTARFYMQVLSVLFVLRGIIAVAFDIEGALEETVAVVAFPIVVLMGLTLVFFGLLLRRNGVDTEDDGEEDDDASPKIGLSRAVGVAGNGMIGVGIAAPVMAAIGYAEAGNVLLYPTTVTLILFGFVVVLQRFLVDVYGLITGQGAEARDGLIAVLIGFLLVLAALPVTALVWGARVTDLTELWARFLEGFDIGGTRISPSNFLTFVIVFVIGYAVTRLLQSTLKQNVLPKTRIDIGGQNALVAGTGYVGIFLAALMAVTVAGLDLSGIAIVAGALSVGIGFGLQTIVSNFVSGIILLIERPISEGDWIEVGGQMGYVKHISVRSTRIETFDRTDVIVPNSDLISGTVTNYTRGNTIGRLIVSVGVAYGTDTKKVDRILREIAEAQPMVLRNPPPNVVFIGFGADSMDFEIRAILRDVNWLLSVKNDINHEIAARFAEEGVEIPFAQRDVWLRNAEVLRPGGEGQADTAASEASVEAASSKPKEM